MLLLDTLLPASPPAADDTVPYALYLWTYASSVLAHAAFFGLPASALWGGLGMGLVAVPLVLAAPPARAGDRMTRLVRAAGPGGRVGRVGAGLAVAGAAHAAVNAALLRRPDPAAGPGRERVSVLLPVRDEAGRVAACLRSVLAQAGVAEILVLDDGSTDGTAAVARAAAGADPRVEVLAGKPLPAGWLGKPHACQQLADAADAGSDVLRLPRRGRAAGARRRGRDRGPAARGTGWTSSRPTPASAPRPRPSGWCSRCCSGPG